MGELKQYKVRIKKHPYGAFDDVMRAENYNDLKYKVEATHGKGSLVFQQEIRQPKPERAKASGNSQAGRSSRVVRPSLGARPSLDRETSRSSGGYSGGGVGFAEGLRNITIIVVVFFILGIVGAIKSCFSPASAPEASAPQTPVASTPVAPAAPAIDPPNVSQNAAQLAPAIPEAPAMQQVQSSATPTQPSVPEHVGVEAPPPPYVPVMHTYFIQVRQANGQVNTINLVAPNEQRAREIVHDHRGNPDILNGPATEQTW